MSAPPVLPPVTSSQSISILLYAVALPYLGMVGGFNGAVSVKSAVLVFSSEYSSYVPAEFVAVAIAMIGSLRVSE